MSKTKKIKQKTTGFDILYRVVTAIACVAMYPVFYFANIFTFAIAHTDISDLLNKFTEESTLHVTDDSISLAKLHSDPFVDLPIKASYEATNLWENETFELKDKIRVTVAPHGVAVYKIKAID
jgi:hypothetical protein